jgi:hypothetical protein
MGHYHIVERGNLREEKIIGGLAPRSLLPRVESGVQGIRPYQAASTRHCRASPYRWIPALVELTAPDRDPQKLDEISHDVDENNRLKNGPPGYPTISMKTNDLKNDLLGYPTIFMITKDLLIVCHDVDENKRVILQAPSPSNRATDPILPVAPGKACPSAHPFEANNALASQGSNLYK